MVNKTSDAYSLLQEARALIVAKKWRRAITPLEEACDMEPDKTSIREDLARAYFHTQQYRAAVAEFEAVIEKYPTNDYAHFCLARSLEMLGKLEEASGHYSLACGMNPGNKDYRNYRNRLRHRLRADDKEAALQN